MSYNFLYQSKDPFKSCLFVRWHIFEETLIHLKCSIPPSQLTKEQSHLLYELSNLFKKNSLKVIGKQTMRSNQTRGFQ